MTVKDLMTPNPACCTMDTPLQQVARMMVQCDCGEIPVVEHSDLMRPVGVVTDRDIVVRALAEGRNPLTLTAGHVMSGPPVTVTPDDSADAVKRLMETHQIRRVPVVGRDRILCGIVSLADIARRDQRQAIGEVVHQVSAPAR